MISGLKEHDPEPSRSIFISLGWGAEQDFPRLSGRGEDFKVKF